MKQPKGIYQNDEYVAENDRYLVRLWWRVVGGRWTDEVAHCQLIHQKTGAQRMYRPEQIERMIAAGKLTKCGNMPTEQAERLLDELRGKLESIENVRPIEKGMAA